MDGKYLTNWSGNELRGCWIDNNCIPKSIIKTRFGVSKNCQEHKRKNSTTAPTRDDKDEIPETDKERTKARQQKRSTDN